MDQSNASISSLDLTQMSQDVSFLANIPGSYQQQHIQRKQIMAQANPKSADTKVRFAALLRVSKFEILESR